MIYLALLQNAEPAPTPSAAPTAPADRSTAFQPVEGGTETRSGSTLMVEAYVVIWSILMVWLVFLWRKQNTLTQRLDGLERAIDRAATKQSSAKPAPAKGTAAAPST